MRRDKLVLIGLLVVLFVAFFMTRPVREKACPLTKLNVNTDPKAIEMCRTSGGVMKDGQCTCPE